MTHHYIDTHTHLLPPDFKNDLDEVLARAKDAGVKYCIIPGTDLKSSKEAVSLAEKYECIYACVGVHPHEAAKARDSDLAEIEKMAGHNKVAAIGEIGLDYYYNFSPKEKQKEFFAAQIVIAARCRLPIVVHTRESMGDTIEIVKNTLKNLREPEINDRRGVFHCFPGTADEAKLLKQLGFYISYTGIVTFKKTESSEVIKQIGLQGILLETDSPYMAPVPKRGKRNEPANIVYIGKKIAEVLKTEEDEVARITSENAMHLFNLK